MGNYNQSLASCFYRTTPLPDALGATEFWTLLAGVAFYDHVISVFMAARRSADGLCKLVTLRVSFQGSQGEEKSSVTDATASAEAECPLLESSGSYTAVARQKSSGSRDTFRQNECNPHKSLAS